MYVLNRRDTDRVGKSECFERWTNTLLVLDFNETTRFQQEVSESKMHVCYYFVILSDTEFETNLIRELRNKASLIKDS